MQTRNLPKSLHTVTVLVRMARKYIDCERYPAESAVHKAIEDLGYTDASDTYGLRAAALAQLTTKGFDL